MVCKCYCVLSFLIITSTSTALKIRPLDVPVSNYKEHGVDGQVLIFDGKTRRFIPPKFPDLPKDEGATKARDLSIFSEWKDKYCKVNFFESTWPPFTAHFREPNWCRFTRTDGRWQSLCCGSNNCDCDALTGLGCKCYPYPNQPIPTNSFDLASPQIDWLRRQAILNDSLSMRSIQ